MKKKRMTKRFPLILNDDKIVVSFKLFKDFFNIWQILISNRI